MSDTKHTPEPWEQFEATLGVAVRAGDGEWEPEQIGDFARMEDAARARACVNACTGMGDPAADITALRAEVEKQAGWCDLMADEFIRISNLTDNGEILGLCERAVANTKNNFPLMKQRDDMFARWGESMREAEALRAEVEGLREALLAIVECGDGPCDNIFHAINITVARAALAQSGSKEPQAECLYDESPCPGYALCKSDRKHTEEGDCALSPKPEPASDHIADAGGNVEPTCEWSQDDDGNWDSACGSRWSFDWDTPKANGMAYCLRCGKPLVERPYVPEIEYEENEEVVNKNKCWWCGGLGTLPIVDFESQKITGKVPCRKCDGTGRQPHD